MAQVVDHFASQICGFLRRTSIQLDFVVVNNDNKSSIVVVLVVLVVGFSLLGQQVKKIFRFLISSPRHLPVR